MRLEILQLADSDMPFGKQLTDLEGWHRTTQDWHRLLRIDPKGMVKARLDGDDVGMAGLLVYDKVAWIHSVIVRKEHRGEGIGRALVEACIDIAERRRAETLKLDSVHGQEDFYEKLGFKPEFQSWRYFRDGEAFRCSAQHMSHSDLREVMGFDKRMVGYDRGLVIEEFHRDAPDLAFVMRDASGIRGYVLARRGEVRVQIGPCVVEPGNEMHGSVLVTSLIGTLPQEKFRICVPSSNEKAMDLVRDLGFESTMFATRMFRGKRFVESEAALAMASPEKG